MLQSRVQVLCRCLRVPVVEHVARVHGRRGGYAASSGCPEPNRPGHGMGVGCRGVESDGCAPRAGLAEASA